MRKIIVDQVCFRLKKFGDYGVAYNYQYQDTITKAVNLNNRVDFNVYPEDEGEDKELFDHFEAIRKILYKRAYDIENNEKSNFSIHPTDLATFED